MNNSVEPPVWFYIVAVVAAAWNGIGIVGFVTEMMQTPQQLAQLSEAERALYTSEPAWATIFFAMAVFGGLLGSVMLLAQKKLAIVLFIASLIGLVGQNSFYFFIARVHETMHASNFVLPVVVFIVAVGLLFFSQSSAKKGWLN